MKLDLSNSLDLNKFTSYCTKLIEKKAKVDLKETKGHRTIRQNKYLHVVLQLYSINYGCTLAETKTDLKRDFGLFYEKNGRKYLISTADLNSKELTEFIDFIRTKSSKDLGAYIPTSEEYLMNHFAIDKEIQRNREFI